MEQVGLSNLPIDVSTKRRFWQADPYPHIALDGFFQPDFFSAVSASMREVAAHGNVTWALETDIERRKRCFSAESFDDNLRQATRLLSSGPFLAYLENLLEVRGLIPLTELKSLSSRSYFHVSSGGAVLGSHVDQSYVGRRFFKKKFHVCSCVFYGSAEWEPSYGGHTILFDATGHHAVTTVECKPNRANIFLHTSTSFHGVSEMTTDRTRYSLYMDYYLPEDRLHTLQERIVANQAKCEPKYWLHNVTFIPRSTHPIYQRIYDKYVRASSRLI